MNEQSHTPAESASPAGTAADAQHAHPWLDALADSFLIEIDDAASDNSDPTQSVEPRHCTLQLTAWRTRLHSACALRGRLSWTSQQPIWSARIRQFDRHRYPAKIRRASF